MKVVQLVGTNGSGKSTVFRRLAEGDRSAYVGAEGQTTIMPTYEGVLVGNYLRGVNTPGVDALRGGKVGILKALDQAVSEAGAFNGGWVGWEGIIILTRAYHFSELIPRGLTPVYIVLLPPLDECFRRIQGRSGKTQSDLKGNGAIVISRERSVRALEAWFIEQGAEVHRYIGEALEDPDTAARGLLLGLLGRASVRSPI